MFDSFYTTISDTIDVYIPLIQLSKCELRMKSKPWVTTALRVSINKKQKLFKKYISSTCISINLIYYHTKFKIYRNKINHLITVSKNNYYNNYFHVNMFDSKKVWKGIRQLVNLESRSGSTTTKVLVEEVEINYPKSMAYAYSNFFASIGNNLAKNIPSVQKSPLQYLTITCLTSMLYLPSRNCI